MASPQHDPCCTERASFSWRKGENVWQQGAQLAKCAALPTDLDADIVILLANADKVRECPSCRLAFAQTFRMPELWWTTYCRKSNGYFGCETASGDDGSIAEINTWTRFLVKLLDGKGQHKWYKMNIFVRWLSTTQQTIVLLFDAPPALKDKMPTPLLQNPTINHLADPFWVYPLLIEEVISLQDVAVWTTRTHVRNAEKYRMQTDPPTPNYSHLHDLARHIIHVSETLDLAVKTMGSVLQQHASFMNDGSSTLPKKAAYRNVHERLLFFEQIFEGLRCRSSSNKERLQNEIQLAFNVVAEYDADISLQIGRATQSDSAAMKTIAFLTLAFLPATFISAIFSTSFFSFDAGSGGWGMSSKIWVYWAFALPVTFVTCALWYFWQWRFDKAWSNSTRANNGRLQLQEIVSN
ncbi:hypothetical protein BGZ61DRAFT_431514 [Ilyonectria robusta]|uniref:uncharacterized protein n=1 Tax=Ilyonectria robusta TaxID=1079257 RepID=UPI001E8DCBF3|nr:uncharacterized protein BGZ61DRAFT_431514 [Ilyonectria robusta]KAH8664804.1 hypothetical protein BGZ61DRAFT_431514 [Ilyonectria robusta]